MPLAWRVTNIDCPGEGKYVWGDLSHGVLAKLRCPDCLNILYPPLVERGENYKAASYVPAHKKVVWKDKDGTN